MAQIKGIQDKFHETTVIVDETGTLISGNNPLQVEGTTTNPWGKQVLLVDDDTVQHTSKNRRKVSTYEVTDFNTFTYGKDEDIWDELIVGTGSTTHNPYLGMVDLSVGTSAGDSITRQTVRIQRYLPGRQNEVSMSVIFGAQTAGIRKRFGVFDDAKGAYFEDDGTDLSCVLRRTTAEGVVEERYARADWSDDKLDGTGPSGITLDISKIQLMVIEYEWYGAGQVEWKFVIDNNAIAIHKIDNANQQDHTWASRGAFPVRVELTNVTGVAGTHSISQGSHSFLTEGTTTLLGRQKSIATGITGKTITNASTFYPMVAIRLKSDALNSVIIPDEYSGATLDNTNVFVRTVEGATITGGTWVSYDSDSPVEYNITATSYTGGTILGTTMISSGNMGNVFNYPDRSITQLKRTTTTTLGDTSSTFMIALATTGTNKAGFASLGWIEVR